MQAREEISPAGRPPLAMSYASWSTFVSRSIERPRAGGVRRQYRAPGKLEVRHRAKPGLAPARVGLLYRCTSTEKARCQAVCQRGLSTPRSIGLDGPGRSAMLEFDLTKASCQITKHECDNHSHEQPQTPSRYLSRMRLRRQKRAPFLRQRVGFSRLTVPRVAVCCGGYAAARGGYAAPGELHAGGGSTAAEFGWVRPAVLDGWLAALELAQFGWAARGSGAGGPHGVWMGGGPAASASIVASSQHHNLVTARPLDSLLELCSGRRAPLAGGASMVSRRAGSTKIPLWPERPNKVPTSAEGTRSNPKS